MNKSKSTTEDQYHVELKDLGFEIAKADDLSIRYRLEMTLNEWDFENESDFDLCTIRREPKEPAPKEELEEVRNAVKPHLVKAILHQLKAEKWGK